MVLFILDTLFLNERQRAPGRGRLVQALGRAGRGLPGVWGGPQVTEREVKNTAGGFGGAGSQLGADRFIYAMTPDFYFGLSSARHRKMVQNPHSVYLLRPSLERGLGGSAIQNNRYYL